MSSNPGLRVRILAVLALILAAGGGAFLLLRGSGSTDSADTTVLPRTTSGTQTTTTKKPNGSNSTPSSEGITALNAALVSHPVVVVSLYAPTVTTDSEAMEEAKAGAKAAGAGFVAFNVYDEKQARQLAKLLSNNFQAANPEVLFFKRPRSLAFELHGFADSQVVAQAASNIYSLTEPWVDEANRICRHYSTSLAEAQAKVGDAVLTTAAGRKQGAEALEQAAALFSEEAQALSKVKADVSKADRYAEYIAALRQASQNTNSEAQALRRNNLAAAQAEEMKNKTLIESINRLVAELQISSCSA
jgi:hypothetical protein